MTFETPESLVRKSKRRFERRIKARNNKIDEKAEGVHKLARFFKECKKF